MQASSLAKYLARAPRYVLQADDFTLVRLAGPMQVPWEEGTDLLDVSTSGLSFTAPHDLAPQSGEQVRIEFTVPGAGKMACYSKVARVDASETHPFLVLVGVEFQELEKAQRIILAQALALKMQGRAIERFALLEGKARKGGLVVLAALALLLWTVLFLALVRS